MFKFISFRELTVEYLPEMSFLFAMLLIFTGIQLGQDKPGMYVLIGYGVLTIAAAFKTRKQIGYSN